MRMNKVGVSAIALASLLMATGTAAYGQAAHMRWDIISLGGSPTCASAGGIASAIAQDGSMIVLHGSGTFVAPAGGGGEASAVTGGGDWETFDASSNSTGSGTYSVTGLVRWEEAAGTLPICDNIGNVADVRSGLAVLRIGYSDGSRGVLVVSCHLPVGAPDTIFEGVRASKGYVDYWNGTAPVPGVDANRTNFHVQ